VTKVNNEDSGAKPKDTSLSLLDMLHTACLVATAFGVFYALKGAPQSDAQAVFRMGVMTVGIVGLITIRAIKWRNGRPS
jgi:hypothetical protein